MTTVTLDPQDFEISESTGTVEKTSRPKGAIYSPYKGPDITLHQQAIQYAMNIDDEFIVILMKDDYRYKINIS